MTVLGVEVRPATASPSTITAGDGVEYDEEADEMRSLVYGVLSTVRDALIVEKLISISKDNLSAHIDLIHRVASGHDVMMADIERALEAEGITHGIMHAEISQGLQRAQETGKRQTDLVIAQGEPVKDGVDGRLEFEVDVGRQVGRKSLETGQIDYRNRSTVTTLRKGDVICRLIPPEPGIPGTDIFGEQILGIPGREVTLPRLENIQFDDEKMEYLAEMSGGFVQTAELLAVTPLYTIEGDVDMESGHIHAEAASVHVKGSVHDLFEITTEGAITIDGRVGDATLVCRGQLKIIGGVVMKGKGRIEAGGSVSVRFCQNATIVAGGDIIIGDSVVNCRLEAGGRIIAQSGKGMIRGGIVKAKRGILARTIGSDLEVPTELIVEQDPVFHQLCQAAHRFRNDLEEIAKLLGQEQPTEERLAGLKAKKAKAVQALLTYRYLAEHNLDGLEKLREPLMASGRESAGGVCAQDVMYPGTRVTILDRTWEIQKMLQAARISYNAAKGRLKSGPIRPEDLGEQEEPQQSLARQAREAETRNAIDVMLVEADRLELARSLTSLREMGDGGVRVLVADDHRLTRTVLRRLLEKWDFTVFEDSGATVLESLLKHSIDLVLLDIAFPGGKNGVQILKEIRAHPVLKDKPVIMMTVHKDKAIVKAAMLAKADDFIIKPFTQDIVTEKVNKVLAKRDPAEPVGSST